MSRLSLYIISDSLGETGELVVKAALSQFKFDNYQIKRFPYVLSVEFLREILEEASKETNVVILYTLVELELIDYMIKHSLESRVLAIDLLSPIINAIGMKTNLEPTREPGAIRKLDETYFKRVDAIEFAVRYDDGKDPRGLEKADVVIIGISRTSKTPLSMYLANKNIKVANIPLVPESIAPKELFQIPRKRIIGLTNSPMKLNEIREERLKSLGLPKGSNYSNLQRILDEIDYAEEIMKKIGCPIIDVSNKAIEETADIIITHLKKSGIKILQD